MSNFKFLCPVLFSCFLFLTAGFLFCKESKSESVSSTGDSFGNLKGGFTAESKNFAEQDTSDLKESKTGKGFSRIDAFSRTKEGLFWSLLICPLLFVKDIISPGI